MKTITYGKVNDAKVYAIRGGFNGELVPCDKEHATHVILCDSGSYPSVPFLEQYICDQVNEGY